MGNNSLKPAVCAQSGFIASNFMGNIFVKSAPVPNRQNSMGNNFVKSAPVPKRPCRAAGSTLNGALHPRFLSKGPEKQPNFAQRSPLRICTYAPKAPADPLTYIKTPAEHLPHFQQFIQLSHSSISYLDQLSQSSNSVVVVLVPLNDPVAVRVDVVGVLIAAMTELHIVDLTAVVIILLAPEPGNLISIESCMAKGCIDRCFPAGLACACLSICLWMRSGSFRLLLRRHNRTLRQHPRTRSRRPRSRPRRRSRTL